METQSSVLRRCTQDDLEALCALGRRTSEDTFGAANTAENNKRYLDSNFNPETVLAELRTPGALFFLLETEGEPVGYMKLNVDGAQTDVHDPDALEVQRFYLDKSVQGSGFAPLMMRRAEEEARYLGKRYLWLGVWEHNARAIRFYEKNGFTRMGEHAFYYGDDLQTDLLYRKEL